MANPVSPAAVPRAINTIENPATKIRVWKRGVRKPTPALRSSTEAPARFARYTGTNGSTQGERKERTPAPKEIKSEISDIVKAHGLIVAALMEGTFPAGS
ncbi:MAG: hypothetical protein DDT25_01107 [Chloroflexi bacterium]|nr:hypothetical protein [Chloroflexota bacterium]